MKMPNPSKSLLFLPLIASLTLLMGMGDAPSKDVVEEISDVEVVDDKSPSPGGGKGFGGGKPGGGKAPATPKFPPADPAVDRTISSLIEELKSVASNKDESIFDHIKGVTINLLKQQIRVKETEFKRIHDSRADPSAGTMADVRPIGSLEDEPFYNVPCDCPGYDFTLRCNADVLIINGTDCDDQIHLFDRERLSETETIVGGGINATGVICNLSSRLTVFVSTACPAAEIVKVYGREGDDHIWVEPRIGADLVSYEPITFTSKLFGEQGNDYLGGGNGSDDWIWGGEGDDVIFGDYHRNIYYIDSIPGNDHLYGGGGDDQIDSGMGEDVILGEGGNDTIWDEGNSQVFGGAGHDCIDTKDVELIGGGSGDDTIYVWYGGIVSGDSGNDFVWARAGDRSALVASGGSGNDILIGSSEPDVFHGGSGNDIIVSGLTDYSGMLANTVFGGTGNDTLGAFEIDFVVPGTGDNTVEDPEDCCGYDYYSDLDGWSALCDRGGGGPSFPSFCEFLIRPSFCGTPMPFPFD